MTLAITSCFQADYNGDDGDYTIEYGSTKAAIGPLPKLSLTCSIFWSICPTCARRNLMPRKP